MEKVAAHPYVVDARRFERQRRPRRDFALAAPALVEETCKLLEAAAAAESRKLLTVRSRAVYIEGLPQPLPLPPCRWRLLLAELPDLIVGRTKPLPNTAAPGVIMAGPGGRMFLWGQQEHPSWSIRQRRSRSRSPR